MRRLALVAVLPLWLDGCFLIPVAMGCDTPPPGRTGSPDCEAITDAVDEADAAVIDAIRTPRATDVPLVPVRLEGRVSDGGSPVARAAVRLMLDDASLAVVRSDAEGRYELTVVVEEPTCADLRLHVSDGERRAEPAAPGCTEAVMDYDFRTAAWTRGSAFGVAVRVRFHEAPGAARRSRTGSLRRATPLRAGSGAPAIR